LNRASFTTKLPSIVGEFLAGPVGGIIALVLVKGFKKIFGKKTMLLKIQILKQINDYYA
jgi:type IV secretory pathway VirB2 component (pilin)